MRTNRHYGKAHQTGTLRERGGFKAADGQISGSVSNQHLIVHVDKEHLVTQTRGLRNQLTSEINCLIWVMTLFVINLSLLVHAFLFHG